MLFARLRELRRTLSFRLTLWYAGIFTVSSLIAFSFFYFQIAAILRDRTDEELLEDSQELSALLVDQGLETVKQTIAREAKEDGVKHVFYRLITPDRKELASSELFFWGPLEISQAALQHLDHNAAPVFETLIIDGRQHKARTIYARIGPGVILQIGISLEDNDEFLANFHQIFGVSTVVVMLFAALIGWFMARRALAQVEEVTQTAAAISASDLDQRVPLQGHADEIDRLATTFNAMLDRIKTLVTETREMTENIAHDLRSPITRIRGVAEMALTTGSSIGDYEAAAASTIEDCDRLLDMINTMLYIAQTEATAEALPTDEVDMTTLVRDACEIFQPLAEDKGVTLLFECDRQLKVRGAVQSLQRMIANLIDNALCYTRASGTITVSVSGDDKIGIVAVKDTGVGMTADELPHIFRRFYRCDRSRSRAGSGLGLTLVQAIVHAHRGQITVDSTPNHGTTFTITLPTIAAHS